MPDLYAKTKYTARIFANNPNVEICKDQKFMKHFRGICTTENKKDTMR